MQLICLVFKLIILVLLVVNTLLCLHGLLHTVVKLLL